MATVSEEIQTALTELRGAFGSLEQQMTAMSDVVGRLRGAAGKLLTVTEPVDQRVKETQQALDALGTTVATFQGQAVEAQRLATAARESQRAAELDAHDAVERLATIRQQLLDATSAISPRA